MKLYIYEHCPYCIRARMIVGLKDMAVTTEVLLNDDEVTPKQMIGQKMLPILAKPDGSYLPESLDIVAWLDSYDGQPLLQPGVEAPITDWLEKAADVYHKLVLPRNSMVDFAEFATAAARDYYNHKKQRIVGDFAQLLQATPDLNQQMQQLLAELENYIVAATACSGKLSYTDIVLFPHLWGLTMVKGLVFGPKVLAYINSMAEQTKIPALFSRAV